MEKLYYSYKEYKELQERTRRNSRQYEQWKYFVKKRDKFRCVECGSPHNLDVHHIERYSDHIETRIKKLNGVTLCRQCHSKHHPWMTKHIEIKTILRKAPKQSDGIILFGAEMPGAPIALARNQ